MKNWQLFLTLVIASLIGCSTTTKNLPNEYSPMGQRTAVYWFNSTDTNEIDRQAERQNYIYCQFTKNCD